VNGPSPLVLLAAGGTGGHMFPAEALAAELATRGIRVALATDDRGRAIKGALADVPKHVIASASPSGGFLGKIKAAFRLGLGVLQASSLIRRLRPAVVVGFGGYPSVPPVFAAARARLPIVLHEQNAVLGRANRLSAGGAARIAVAFDHVERVPADRADRVVRVGNPVRPAIDARRDDPYVPPGADGPIHLFVMGGSQGARVLSENVPAALALLPVELRSRIRLTQQARPADLEGLNAALEPLGLASVETAAFIDDVPERLSLATLAITRAGASTIAELTRIGRPAILIPYPHAADDHQSANARRIADAGAALVMPQGEVTPETLAERLRQALSDPEGLTRAARAAHALGEGDAAARLADVVCELIDPRFKKEADE